MIGSDSISSSIDSVTLSLERMLPARFPLSSRLYALDGDTVGPSHSNSCLQYASACRKCRALQMSSGGRLLSKSDSNTNSSSVCPPSIVCTPWPCCAPHKSYVTRTNVLSCARRWRTTRGSSSVDSCSQIRPSTSSVPCTRACRPTRWLRLNCSSDSGTVDREQACDEVVTHVQDLRRDDAGERRRQVDEQVHLRYEVVTYVALFDRLYQLVDDEQQDVGQLVVVPRVEQPEEEVLHEVRRYHRRVAEEVHLQQPQIDVHLARHRR